MSDAVRTNHRAPSRRAVARRISAIAVAGAVLLPLAAWAHHGWGSYDADKPITIDAAIEEVTIGNPHGSMMLPYQGARWEVILAPPSRMNARGATADRVVKGRPVKAYGYPRRDGTPEMRAEWIEIEGKRIDLR